MEKHRTDGIDDAVLVVCAGVCAAQSADAAGGNGSGPRGSGAMRSGGKDSIREVFSEGIGKAAAADDENDAGVVVFDAVGMDDGKEAELYAA